MKTRTVLFVLMLCLIFALPAYSGILVVDNNGGNNAHYSTFPSAYTAAVAGDTIYVVGSPTWYGHHAIAKQLTIIGPGWGLDQNTGNQASQLTADIDFEFQGGSEGSVVMGVRFFESTFIFASNISLIRCHSWHWRWYSVQITDASSILIKQCYFYNSNNESDSRSAIEINNNSDNITIANTFLSNPMNAIRVEGESGPIYIDRCVMTTNMVIYNTTVTNSIFLDGTITGGTNIFQNNLCNGTQFPSGDGNIQSVDMSTVFIEGGTFDGHYTLVTGSPAIGAASDDGDCGIFGGPDPYVLSGVPPVPVISWFYAPASGSPATGLDVNMTVRARN